MLETLQMMGNTTQTEAVSDKRMLKDQSEARIGKQSYDVTGSDLIQPIYHHFKMA